MNVGNGIILRIYTKCTRIIYSNYVVIVLSLAFVICEDWSVEMRDQRKYRTEDEVEIMRKNQFTAMVYQQNYYKKYVLHEREIFPLQSHTSISTTNVRGGTHSQASKICRISIFLFYFDINF